jgi:hypothetical protein
MLTVAQALSKKIFGKYGSPAVATQVNARTITTETAKLTATAVCEELREKLEFPALYP